MTRTRACDPCATRKIKCDRGNPCRRCRTLDIPCTTSRVQSKPGPKGPWAEKRRLARLQQTALQHPANLLESQFAPIIPERLHGDGGSSSSSSTVESPPTNNQFTSSLPIPLIQQYLDVYHEQLYPVWPVVDRDEMVSRIQDPEDSEAYALCTALTAVVLAHLKFNPTDITQASHTIDNGSTVLIREAITLAQFLELDQAKHYKRLSKKEAQLHLRIIWILSITERGHTTRFDLPRILRLDPDLPPLETQDVQPGLVAFTDLCQLFQTFGRAMDSDMLLQTSEFFIDTDQKLQEKRQLQSKTKVQQADFLITQQWMRIMVWKMSIFHIKLSVNADDENLSICFPERVAQIVLTYLNNLSRNIIEAHGIGMQMKLADVAISLADMLSCIPWVSERRQVMKVGPGDMVCHIAQTLASLRGNVNPRMEILFEKLSSRGWGCSPRSMATSDVAFESLPATTPIITTTTTTVLPIRQIEEISDETGKGNGDNYDDYVKRITLHTPGGY
ncbi:hypothetical protein ZTR_02299 [Talaromyces verruculosus]|nr:hypothetical protein ZTR_02299 [Talaromyces verruculosus]